MSLNLERFDCRVVFFFQIISAWAKSRDPRSAEKGEELIQMMEKLYESDKIETGDASQLFPLSQTYTVSITFFMTKTPPS